MKTWTPDVGLEARRSSRKRRRGPGTSSGGGRTSASNSDRVARRDLGDRPVLPWLVDVSTCLPKISSFSAARTSGSALQDRRRSLGSLTTSACPVMTQQTQGLRQMASIPPTTLARIQPVLPSEPGWQPTGRRSFQFLGRGNAVEPRPPRTGATSREWIRVADRQFAVGRAGPRVLVGGLRPAEPVLVQPLTGRWLAAPGPVPAVAVGHRPDVRAGRCRRDGRSCPRSSARRRRPRSCPRRRPGHWLRR